MHYTNDRVTIRFDGGIELSRPWLDADSARAQRVLRSHSKERATCQCTPSGVPMHVVHRLGRFHLATMPGRAHHHALSCPSYQQKDDVSGLKQYNKSALSRAAGRHKITVSTSDLGRAPYSHFSPSAALQFLWMLAGLNISTPKIVETRTFYIVSHALARAAATLCINGESVRPYIPLAVEAPEHCRYLVGQVRRVFDATHGNGLCLSADKKNTFWVKESHWGGLSDDLGDFKAPDVSGQVWVMGRLWRSPQNNLHLYDVGSVSISSAFLPVTKQTSQLIDDLVSKKRRFFVCLRYDATDDAGIPAAVLLDKAEPRNLYTPRSH